MTIFHKLSIFHQALLEIQTALDHAESCAPYLDSLQRQKDIMVNVHNARQSLATLKMLWRTK